MLFFRSEEAVTSWCLKNAVTRRPRVTLNQLWALAVAWYSTRLLPSARRPGPDEMRTIFESIGLTDPFWDAASDRFE